MMSDKKKHETSLADLCVYKFITDDISVIRYTRKETDTSTTTFRVGSVYKYKFKRKADIYFQLILNSLNRSDVHTDLIVCKKLHVLTKIASSLSVMNISLNGIFFGK